jgi:hypothetical protein
MFLNFPHYPEMAVFSQSPNDEEKGGFDEKMG